MLPYCYSGQSMRTPLLAERLGSNIPERVLRRGATYQRQGAVELVQGGAEAVEALVYGTEQYSVALYWSPEDRLLEGVCSCPDFAARLDICKHVWATILEADANGFLEAARQASSPRLEADVHGPFVHQAARRAEIRAAMDRDISAGPIRSAAETTSSFWRSHLTEVAQGGPSLPPSEQPWLDDRQILYLLDVEASKRSDAIIIDLRYRDRAENGDWGAIEVAAPERETISHLPDAADRQLLAMIAGAREAPGGAWYGVYDALPDRFMLPAGNAAAWVELAAATGRLLLPPADGDDASVLEWDAGEPWRLELEISRGSDPRSDGELPSTDEHLRLAGLLARNGISVPVADPVLVSPTGLVFFDDRVARLDKGGLRRWVPVLRREGALEIPAEERHELVETLFSLPRPRRLHLPDDMDFDELPGEARPRLTIGGPADAGRARQPHLEISLDFDYGGRSVAWDDERVGVYLSDPARFVRRDLPSEERALERLRELGVRQETARPEGDLSVPERRLSELVRVLVLDGWRVEADGNIYRRADSLDLEVTSGIDWFDLEGTAEFGDQSVPFPRLLAAVARGETNVLLDDGSLGVVPDEWLDKYGSLARMGALEDEHLRFQASQVGLLDALLAARPEIGFDEATAQARQRLEAFSRIDPMEPPPTFVGELRDYQKDGLGWLHFLREFGFGGCLADDMGLGKTVQVLALLEGRRQARETEDAPEGDHPGPSLVVVPKSLIFNWRREAERFTPRLRLLDYTGPRREQERERLADYDVVLTTYGTLRRDIAWLQDVRFDYAILDEAQTIKNHKSATAKASRLLVARHRLALTGTPIENHVGELMSILDFLNPGLFGPGRRLEAPRVILEGTLEDDGEEHQQLALIAGAVRPFILRRTKAQVAQDLPDKVEQTLYCELTPAQRDDYDQLRQHYRSALLDRVDGLGIGQSRMQVLEALLRLRQTACHPGLIDPERRDEDGGKLELLLPQLDEVLEEGHKALVFSQFTSMLAIVRAKLDALGVTYEYLDGKTRDREDRVHRFQEDPDCMVFLISLKAGGLGLNLTAAEYVFLLDPWWNPAVEAQAIDRTHRIGQTRTVFAYSLIARDTVEEKVLALQESKRELADAIIRADSSLIRNLTREDLAELLS